MVSDTDSRQLDAGHRYKALYIWISSIMEVSMRWMIDLWETQNKDVHGHTESEQNSRLKAKHQETF